MIVVIPVNSKGASLMGSLGSLLSGQSARSGATSCRQRSGEPLKLY